MHTHHQQRLIRELPRPADPALRVGDAERGQVIDQLADHHAAGRLTSASSRSGWPRPGRPRPAPTWRSWSGTCRPCRVVPPSPGRRPAPAPPRLDGPVRTYLVVMALLWLIWLVTGAELPWPIWPMLGWGIGVAGHAGRAWTVR